MSIRPENSPLREALSVCAASETSGALRITGDPGGTIHLAGGLVTAVETSAAPSAEGLLLRSGRVSDAEWDEAFKAAVAAGRPMGAELTGRGLVGTGELEALLATALADAMFAVASGIVEEYRAELGTPASALPVRPGHRAEELLAEVARRTRVLEALPSLPRHERLRAADAPPAGGLTGSQRELLALADGRRTPRDLAFILGRGVYATTVQLARLHQTGHLVVTSPPQAAPRHARPAEPEPDDGGVLPRRFKNAFTRVRGPAHRSPEVRPPLGLLRPRSGRDVSPGQP